MIKNLPCKLTHPYPVTLLLIGLSYFQPNPLSYVYPNFSQKVSLFTYLLMKMEQSVPKRRHIKFRRRGITQKKTYNMIKNVYWFHVNYPLYLSDFSEP